MKKTAKILSALALTLGGPALQAVAKPPQGMPEAIINWSMAERTVRIENRDFKDELYNGNYHWMIEGPGGVPGLYGGVSSVPLDQINPPQGYRVTLDGCSSTGNITQYEWKIDGSRVSKSKDCRFTTSLPEGSYQLQLTVNGGGRKNKATEVIEPRDILVVVLGDSYSSGEGNPTRYDASVSDSSYDDTLTNNGAGWSEGGYWDYANCHRSGRAGQANAIIDLERADPHSSVTTLFLACSGAQIDSGIQGVKDGYLGAPEKPQTYLAYELVAMNGRDIEAVLIGISGNDVGFVPVVSEGLLQPDVFLSKQLSPILPGTPPLPFVGDRVSEPQVPNLLLTPDAAYVDPLPSPPGPPLRQFEPEALHACESQYQKAALGEGDLGPAEACRESIGTTEFGLADVNRCLTGNGDEDCVFARSYYDFDAEVWRYNNPADAGFDMPERWPGLGVAPDRVFYTEYPDLTTRFVDDDPNGELAFCSISLDKDAMLDILRVLLLVADNKELIRQLIEIVKDFPDTTEFGLAQNEFQWASEAVLNGPLDPDLKALILTMTSEWRVPILPVGNTVIGANDVDLVNLGNDAPALNEITELAGTIAYYSWFSVIGTHDLASGHGLCTPQPTGNPIGDLTAAYAYLVGPLNGTNISGSAHPNITGQNEAFRPPIAAALQAELLD
jgi:hypothetical protein